MMNTMRRRKLKKKLQEKNPYEILQPKMQTRMKETQNHQHQDQKVPNPSKKRKKILKTPKGPSSVEDIKAKMQVSIEKAGFLSRVEAKFINYMKNCFQMTDQEVIQDLQQWRNSVKKIV